MRQIKEVEPSAAMKILPLNLDLPDLCPVLQTQPEVSASETIARLFDGGCHR